MRATFEHGGTIIDIGTNISPGALDTTGNYGGCSGSSQQTVGVALYQRDLVDQKVVTYKGSFYMKPSEARAMASAMLSCATEAKA